MLRGPVTIREYSVGHVERLVRLKADDPLVVEMNEWAKREFDGAGVDVVNYAPRLLVTGENFGMTFQASRVVIDLNEKDGPSGSWSAAISASDPMAKTLRSRLAAGS